MSSSIAYIQELHAQIEKLTKENEKLKAKLKGRKRRPSPETKKARTDAMKASWERGGFNFHRSEEYQKWEKDYNWEKLDAYHAEFPEQSTMGDVYRIKNGLPTREQEKAQKKKEAKNGSEAEIPELADNETIPPASKKKTARKK